MDNLQEEMLQHMAHLSSSGDGLQKLNTGKYRKGERIRFEDLGMGVIRQVHREGDAGVVVCQMDSGSHQVFQCDSEQIFDQDEEASDSDTEYWKEYKLSLFENQPDQN